MNSCGRAILLLAILIHSLWPSLMVEIVEVPFLYQFSSHMKRPLPVIFLPRIKIKKKTPPPNITADLDWGSCCLIPCHSKGKCAISQRSLKTILQSPTTSTNKSWPPHGPLTVTNKSLPQAALKAWYLAITPCRETNVQFSRPHFQQEYSVLFYLRLSR